MMKVSELEGAALDLWVARADGLEPIPGQPEGYFFWHNDALRSGWFDPSTDWAIGGPIIASEQVTIRAELYGDAPIYFARAGLVRSKRVECSGSTHLIAAMRAFVASKYGDTVPDA